MKILFYINTLRHGGAERVITNLANEFSQIGCNVVVVTSFSAENEYYVSQHVKRVVLFKEKIIGRVKRNWKLITRLRQTIKTEMPDVVVSFMAEPNFRSVLACLGLKCKNIISVRNDPNKEYSSRISKILAKCLFRLADGVVFQTNEAKSWFPKKIQQRSAIIPNQVDRSFYNICNDGTKKDIVTTGRLVSQKNHKMLIEAFSYIAQKVDDNLIIYGEGELRNDLQAQINKLNLDDRVFLPGIVNDVPSVLKRSKVFVLSSDYEGMPNSLLEAMAAGNSCIATDCPCGGPRAIIRNGENGLLVPIGDSKAMSNAIEQVCLMTASELNEISKKASISAEDYRPEIVFSKWNSYIEGIVANSNR